MQLNYLTLIFTLMAVLGLAATQISELDAYPLTKLIFIVVGFVGTAMNGRIVKPVEVQKVEEKDEEVD